jgi:hypothetical protein
MFVDFTPYCPCKLYPQSLLAVGWGRQARYRNADPDDHPFGFHVLDCALHFPALF